MNRRVQTDKCMEGQREQYMSNSEDKRREMSLGQVNRDHTVTGLEDLTFPLQIMRG